MKKIFITGATSYLGKLFIKYNPELKFFALQNRSKIIDTPNVKVVNNPEEMINIVENEQITQFIHLANMFKGLKIQQTLIPNSLTICFLKSRLFTITLSALEIIDL